MPERIFRTIQSIPFSEWRYSFPRETRETPPFPSFPQSSRALKSPDVEPRSHGAHSETHRVSRCCSASWRLCPRGWWGNGALKKQTAGKPLHVFSSSSSSSSSSSFFCGGRVPPKKTDPCGDVICVSKNAFGPRKEAVLLLVSLYTKPKKSAEPCTKIHRGQTWGTGKGTWCPLAGLPLPQCGNKSNPQWVTTQRLPIDFGPSNNLVLRPPTTSGVSKGRVGSSIQSPRSLSRQRKPSCTD